MGRSKKCEASKSVLKRDDYGVPIICGGSSYEVWKTLGYAHATDRLWQIFNRYISATGRLSEFYGPDYIGSDKNTLNLMYTKQDIDTQFNALKCETRKAHKGFLKGLNKRIREVNANSAILPYEFKQSGILVVPEFTLFDLMTFAVGLMRGVTSGQRQDGTQLANAEHYGALLAKYGGDVNQVLSIMADTSPIPGQFTIEPVEIAVCDEINSKKVLQKKAKASSKVSSRAVDVAAITKRANMARDVTSKMEENDRLLSELGVLIKDGSWCNVFGPSRTVDGSVMFQAQPQDPLNFPSTFYQAHIESKEADIMCDFFTEPGCPINQIYGTWHGFVAGRNRGYFPANDYAFESSNNASVYATYNIKVLGQPNVPYTVYRSTSTPSGWVVARDTVAGTQVTLRSVFLGQDMRGLNMLIGLFRAHSLEEYLNLYTDLSYQSYFLHSHVEYGDKDGNIALCMNGLWTDLRQEFPDYDRRFPQGFFGEPLLTYGQEVVRPPVIDVNNCSGYYSGWNSAIAQLDVYPTYSAYRYMGHNATIKPEIEANGKFSFDDLKNLTVTQDQKWGLMGLNFTIHSQDRFDIWFREAFFAAVNALPTPERLQAVAFLDSYREKWIIGSREYTGTTPDINDQWMLSNSWQRQFIYDLTLPSLAGTPLEPLDMPAGHVAPFLTVFSFQYFYLYQNIASLVTNGNPEITHDWLGGRDLQQLIVDALDTVLVKNGGFAARPWGTGLRSTIPQEWTGGFGVLNELPASQRTAIIHIMKITSCGVVQNESVIPFGNSGEVLSAPNGEPIFTPHTRDQEDMYEVYLFKKNKILDSVQRKLNSEIIYCHCNDKQKEKCQCKKC